jgi:NTP pyrophosphatase (non-canonical NTP hydrolase)
MKEQINITKYKKLLDEFSRKRDWKKFHSPKNLVMALGGEVGELTEIFQWLTGDESKEVVKDRKKKKEIADEIADILMYTIMLAGELQIDINVAIHNKYKKNIKKYPEHLVKGSCKKYREY